jgi:LysR family glycine cleavage system transcriptional activator
MTDSSDDPQRQRKFSRLRKTEPRALPPLNSLRAFDAAARHQGFASAGAELNVSPGAISRQVKLLEEVLGVELFRRAAQGVELTEPGQRLLGLTDSAFEILAQALPQSAPRGPLSCQVSASFYLRWLLPRYQAFRAALPQLKINLDVTSTADAQLQSADLSILYHRFAGDVPDAVTARSERLFFDGSILVCAPSLLGRRKLPLPLSALAKLPLLLNTPDGWDWRALAAARNLRPLPLSRAARFDIDDGAIQAALAGQGIAFAERRFVSDLLAQGQLVRPFDLPSASFGEYRLHWRGPVARRPALAQLRHWLRDEVGKQRP